MYVIVLIPRCLREKKATDVPVEINWKNDERKQWKQQQQQQQQR